MIRREPSIVTKLARVDLQRDCEAAGYTTDDAGRLADRIVGGWLLPGLAKAPAARSVLGVAMPEKAPQGVFGAAR
jgi:hypothetical protein